MAKKSVIVLQDSLSGIQEVISSISTLNNFEVVGSSCDGEQGLELVKNHNPDFLILGIVLKTLDGVAVMEEIKKLNLKTKVVILSSFTSESVISRAMSAGAIYYLAKPYKPEVLRERLTELTSDNISNNKDLIVEMKRRSLDEKISKIFISVGIPPHIKGYQYLREGVKMAVNDPDVINHITKLLYPSISVKYKTTASKVERAIRHAIEVAFNRGRIEAINNLLGIHAYGAGDKPTNGEFIALIADKMLLEGAWKAKKC